MLNRKISTIIAVIFLGIMLVLMFFSALNDSLTMDELAHTPAGYSYLSQKDYRLNPEHPPLIKDLAAVPLLFLNLNFPDNVKSWTDDINGQWDFGRAFFYESGNNADKIIFWSRIPMMLLALLFGWLLFSFVRSIYGDKVGLLTLFFFTFSPTFIAHSRYVTTDLAAAFGFFLGLVVFYKFLMYQNYKYIILTGIVFGIAQLLKFSLVLLIPIYFILAVLWVFLEHFEHLKYLSTFKKRALHILRHEVKMIGKLVLIGLIGIAVIWPVYQFHVWNYPMARQLADTESILSSFGFRPLVNLTLWLVKQPILRALGQYMLGLLMVIQRAGGGNTTFFLGQISATGWWYYFPVAYLLKEHLAFHILSLFALVIAIRFIMGAKEKTPTSFIEWMRDNFALTMSIIFILLYWGQSMKSNLNIGVRHVLPTFPFIYFLVSRELIKWVQTYSYPDPKSFKEWLQSIYEKYIKAAPKYLIIGAFLLWIFLTSILAFPNYLSYYNELILGPQNGHLYIVDSNYDWGQDLKRLKDFVEDHNINKIYLDYFGGGSPAYYFGEKFEPWWSTQGEPPKGSWFAISATFRQNGYAVPIKNFQIKSEDTYPWLKKHEPVARAGYSIFIYKIE